MYISSSIPKDMILSKFHILENNKAHWWVKGSNENVIHQLTISLSLKKIDHQVNANAKPHEKILALPEHFKLLNLDYVSYYSHGTGAVGEIPTYENDKILILGNHKSASHKPIFLFYP